MSARAGPALPICSACSNCPEKLQQWLLEERLTVGHAKALLSLSGADAIVDAAREMIREHYSVRQAELLVAQHVKGSGSKKTRREGDPNVRAALVALERALGTKVAIRQAAKGRGKIEIHFHSPEELERLYNGLLQARF